MGEGGEFVRPVAVHQSGKALRDAGADCEIDEMDQRQRLHGREIDRDVGRRQEEADHENVGIGQNVDEPLDEEDGQRDHHPAAHSEGARARRSLTLGAVRDRHELEQGGRIDGDDGGVHAGFGTGRRADRNRDDHQDQQQERAHDIGRQHGVERPGMAPRHPLHQVRKPHHRQADHAEQERHDMMRLDPVG